MIQKTKEEKARLVEQVKNIVQTEKLSIKAACEKTGIKYLNYFIWNKDVNGPKKAKKVAKPALAVEAPKQDLFQAVLAAKTISSDKKVKILSILAA